LLERAEGKAADHLAARAGRLDARDRAAPREIVQRRGTDPEIARALGRGDEAILDNLGARPETLHDRTSEREGAVDAVRDRGLKLGQARVNAGVREVDGLVVRDGDRPRVHADTARRDIS